MTCQKFKVKAVLVPFVILLPPASISAQRPRNQETYKMLPDVSSYPADELAKRFSRHQITPFGNAKLSFEILLPRSWRVDVREVDADRLAEDDQARVTMADFYTDDTDVVWADAHFLRLPDQVTPAGFIDVALRRNPWTRVVRQSVELNGLAAEDILVRFEDRRMGPALRRVTAIRHGEFIFYLEGTAIESEYEKYKSVLGVAATSFRPTSK